MPVTLTDEQVAELRTRLGISETNARIAEAAAGLWNDPDTSAEAKALWKRKYPDSDLGDAYNVEQRLNARLDRQEQDAQKREREAREKAIDEQIASKRRDAQERHRATDDAMKRLEDWMVEKNVGDYDVAAEHFFTRQPGTSNGDDSAFDSQFWHHDRSDLFKEISADPEEWGRKEILKTIREGEQRNRGGW